MKRKILLTVFSVLLCVLFCPAVFANYDYHMVISFSDLELKLFNEKNQLIGAYPLCLPRSKPKLPIEGEVAAIQLNPSWFPSESTRVAYAKQRKVELPKSIGPNSKMNAMGKAKISFKFLTPGVKHANLIRIHGTNKPKSIGRRESRGCIRMHNDDILELTKIIKNKHVKLTIVEKV